MNKKGFTLVELLLVLVIIGIIGVLTIPRIMESLKESRGAGGDSTEKLLLHNLELYNEDNKYDLWPENTPDHKCIAIASLDTLKSSNRDVSLGDECRLNNGSNSLIIEKVGKNKYKYYVAITCSRKGSTEKIDEYHTSTIPSGICSAGYITQ